MTSSATNSSYYFTESLMPVIKRWIHSGDSPARTLTPL